MSRLWQPPNRIAGSSRVVGCALVRYNNPRVLRAPFGGQVSHSLTFAQQGKPEKLRRQTSSRSSSAPWEIHVTLLAARVYANRDPLRKNAGKNHISKRTQKPAASVPVRRGKRGTTARRFRGVSPKTSPAAILQGPACSRVPPDAYVVTGPEKLRPSARSRATCAGNRRGRQIYFT